MTMTVKYLTVDGEILSETRSGTRSDYIPDPLGSTSSLLSSTHTINDTYSWWPYGELRNHSGASVTPLGYGGTKGYYTAPGTTFGFARRRVLRPQTSNWQTVDPIWPSERAFAYCRSNPTTMVDPSGLACDVPPNAMFPIPSGPSPAFPPDVQRPVTGIKSYTKYSQCMRSGILSVPACQKAMSSYFGNAPNWIYAYLECIIDGESEWSSTLETPTGNPRNPGYAWGLTQITDVNADTCRALGYGDYRTNPCSNIKCGAALLCQCLNQNGGDILKCAGTFNAIGLNASGGTRLRYLRCLAQFGLGGNNYRPG